MLKALGEAGVAQLASLAGAEKGDAVLIVAGKAKTVAASLGALRNEVARREKLIPSNVYAPLWVTEFPMFEYHEDDDRYYAMHHPFTSPLDEDLELLERAVDGGETALLGKLRTKAYDPVINGVELASGSIRIHRRDVQRLVFKALGMTTEEARSRFGFFDALEFGTPPHGGIAPGIERLLMVLVPTENIRDVMAFPKDSFSYGPDDRCTRRGEIKSSWKSYTSGSWTSNKRAICWDRGRLARRKQRVHARLNESGLRTKWHSTKAGETPAVPGRG